MNRRNFLLLSLGTLLAAPGQALEAGKPAISLGAAINKSGRQRMLSQRMAKAYAMQMVGVMPDKAVGLLAASRQLFEVQLGELKGVAPNEAVQGGLGELERAWAAYRAALEAPRGPEGSRAVLVESEKTLRAAHALTALYEKQAASSAGRLVNLSGRQRMLSQRMAKCFMFQQSGLAPDSLRQEMETARRDFVAALAELNAAPENTDEIRTELGLANTQWLFFEQAMNGREPNREIAARNVATTSERILEVMDNLTGRYERLVRG